MSVRARLIGHLQDRHGVSVEISPDETQEGGASFFDETRRHLTLSMALAAPSINFHLALLIGQLSYEDDLRSLTHSKTLSSEAAIRKAKSALANYFAGACLLPYDEFLKAANDTRYNVEVLQHRFSASFEQEIGRASCRERV